MMDTRGRGIYLVFTHMLLTNIVISLFYSILETYVVLFVKEAKFLKIMLRLNFLGGFSQSREFGRNISNALKFWNSSEISEVLAGLSFSIFDYDTVTFDWCRITLLILFAPGTFPHDIQKIYKPMYSSYNALWYVLCLLLHVYALIIMDSARIVSVDTIYEVKSVTDSRNRWIPGIYLFFFRRHMDIKRRSMTHWLFMYWGQN